MLFGFLLTDTDRWTNIRADGQTNGLTVGHTDAQTDKQTNIQIEAGLDGGIISGKKSKFDIFDSESQIQPIWVPLVP